MPEVVPAELDAQLEIIPGVVKDDTAHDEEMTELLELEGTTNDGSIAVLETGNVDEPELT